MNQHYSIKFMDFQISVEKSFDGGLTFIHDLTRMGSKVMKLIDVKLLSF